MEHSQPSRAVGLRESQLHSKDAEQVRVAYCDEPANLGLNLLELLLPLAGEIIVGGERHYI